MTTNTKYIFVTGGVVSSLGKGITAASLGRLLKSRDDCFIMFGKESAGIPEEILLNNQETCVRIPMINEIRSLNLSNSVAIVLYEALRQHDFSHMQLGGHLTKYDWK